ncbi:MAG TPA: flagellar brake domain-containing protein [Syntrophomonadaceae bacterium]|nr:flagellar brake domain-containing protein [Syntrophomonadaceae bacterium]
MKVDDIKLNQLVQIEYQTDPTNVTYLSSRVEGKTNEFLYLAIPIRRGELIPLRKGSEIKVVFTHEKNTYSFTTLIMERQREPIPVLKVHKPENLVRIQRRSYVRLLLNLEATFSVLPDQTEHKGTTLDVSGGGVLLITKTELEKGQILDFRLDIPENDPIYCKAEVIRVLDIAKTSFEDSKVAIKFLDIHEAKRDQIFKYIFKKEREWIRKGLME